VGNGWGRSLVVEAWGRGGSEKEIMGKETKAAKVIDNERQEGDAC
jgi:hypothetical protein